MVMWPFPPTRETESPRETASCRSRGEGGGSVFSGLSDRQGRHGCPGRTAFPSLTLSAAGWLCASVPLSVCRENAPICSSGVQISDLTSLPCLRAKFLPLFRALRAVAPFQKTVPPGRSHAASVGTLRPGPPFVPGLLPLPPQYRHLPPPKTRASVSLNSPQSGNETTQGSHGGRDVTESFLTPKSVTESRVTSPYRPCPCRP